MSELSFFGGLRFSLGGMESGEKDRKERSCYYFEIEHMFGACKEKSEHTPQGERIVANCDNKSCKSGAQRNSIFLPTTKLSLF